MKVLVSVRMTAPHCGGKPSHASKDDVMDLGSSETAAGSAGGAVEMNLTRSLRFHIGEACATVRTAPPTSLPHGADIMAWTGDVPVPSGSGTPIPADGVPTGAPVPGQVPNTGSRRDASFLERLSFRLQRRLIPKRPQRATHG